MEFYWDKETLNYFFELAIQKTKKQVKKEIEEFVEFDCHLEDGETEEMLVDDLMRQIYRKSK